MTDTSDAPPRRSFTLPTKLNPIIQRNVDSFKASENDLFYHPSAKVVHFSPRAVVPIPSSGTPSDFDYPVDTIETLPWRSPTERTVAFAPLRLENVHGLTVFLKCGSVVHAILKNSQCWCVDGDSIFVLRIRPLTYYRIELPNETDQDKVFVDQMKAALPKILRYEVTPCPFKRGFTVEIPEEAKVRRRKKAWRPKVRRESAPISSAYCRENLRSTGVATPDSLSAIEGTDGNATDDRSTPGGSTSTILEAIPDNPEPLPAPISIPALTGLPRRSVSETRQSFQTLLATFEDTAESHAGPEPPLSSSVDSFHSIELTLSPYPTPDPYLTPPSPISPTDTQPAHCEMFELQSSASDQEPASQDSVSPKPLVPVQEVSEPTGLAEYSSSRQESRLPCAFPVDLAANRNNSSKTADSNPNFTSMSAEFRRRSKASREREISPMPPASTLILANPQKQDAASIIQKTCTLVLVPPIQLLIVLIHIAARIVIGPAINSAVGDLDRKFECRVSNPREAVDDFDLPLAPDRPRKPSVSENTRHRDPSDLN